MASLIFVNRFFYPDHSATSQLLTDLTVALVEQGWEVKVLTSTQRYDEARANLQKRDVYQGVQIVRLKGFTLGRSHLLGRALDYLSFYLIAAWRLLWDVKSGDIVVFKTDPPMMSAFLWPFVRIKKAKYINWLQDLFPEVAIALGIKGLKGPLAKLLFALRNSALRRAQTNICLSQGMADRLGRLGVRQQAIEVIPNWTDVSAIRPVAVDKNPLRESWGLDSDFVLGYSGNMGRAHDFDAIIEAAKRLKSHSDIHFVFIGEGAAKQKLQQVKDTFGLQQLSFHGYQPRNMLSQSLSVPDVHFISLRPELEGCIVPSKFYGVLAAGRVCLFIGDVEGGMSKQIHEYGLGASVRPDDVQVLVDLILEMKSDRKALLQMGNKARTLAVSDYDFSVCLNRWQQTLSRFS